MSKSQIIQSVFRSILYEIGDTKIDPIVEIIIEYLRISLGPNAIISPFFEDQYKTVTGNLGSWFLEFKQDDALMYNIPSLRFEDFQKKYDRPILGWWVQQICFLSQNSVTLIMPCQGSYLETHPNCMIELYLDLNQYHDLFWKWLADHEKPYYLHTHLDLIL